MIVAAEGQTTQTFFYPCSPSTFIFYVSFMTFPVFFLCRFRNIIPFPCKGFWASFFLAKNIRKQRQFRFLHTFHTYFVVILVVRSGFCYIKAVLGKVPQAQFCLLLVTIIIHILFFSCLFTTCALPPYCVQLVHFLLLFSVSSQHHVPVYLEIHTCVYLRRIKMEDGITFYAMFVAKISVRAWK